MKQPDVEAFVAALPSVQRVDSFGYAFFFVGEDHRVPFVTIADSDNEYDSVSNLNREGVFRVNIGVSKDTFQKLVGEMNSQERDYSELNVFMPHPHYSRQHFVCIVNPDGVNADETRRLIVEAHAIAEARLRRKAKD